MSRIPDVELLPGRLVGDGRPALLVAEIGQNHNGRLDLARELIAGAAAAGAGAVKFCKRDLASELTGEAARRPYTGRNSFAATYGEHRRALELSRQEHAELRRHALDRGIPYFATACDVQSVDDLLAIGVPCFKVASRDLTNLPLIEHMARTELPIILSCGMDGLDEIGPALDTVRMHHEQVVLLQCTSAYPTADEDVNLRAMATLRREFDVLVGLSDHTPGIVVPLAAAALGAVLIEKHITLDRWLPGTDHACSLELPELRRMVEGVRRVEAALGDGVKRVPASAARAKAKLRRSVVSRCRIPQGARLTEEMLCLKTAGDGLTWADRQRLLGKTALRDIPADSRLSTADVE